MSKGQHIGYVRVSTEEQKIDRQLHLESTVLDRIFIDRASGKNMDRPELQNMLQFIRDGDRLYVHSMDRLARNLDELRSIVKQLTEKGVTVHFVKEGLIFNNDASPMSQLLLSVMGSFAEFERGWMLERQREGIALAKQKGVYKGRKKMLVPEQVTEIKELIAQGLSKSVIARKFEISRRSLYRYLEESQCHEA